MWVEGPMHPSHSTSHLKLTKHSRKSYSRKKKDIWKEPWSENVENFTIICKIEGILQTFFDFSITLSSFLDIPDFFGYSNEKVGFVFTRIKKIVSFANVIGLEAHFKLFMYIQHNRGRNIELWKLNEWIWIMEPNEITSPDIFLGRMRW